VRFYSPLVMLTLLSVFALDRLFPWPRRPNHPRYAAAVVILFAALQLWPRLYPGDFKWRREGMNFSLFMFDEARTCHAYLTLPHEPKIPLFPRMIQDRLACDPNVFRSLSAHWCRHQTGDPDLFVFAKRALDRDFHPLIAQPHICSHPLAYDPIRPSPWILN
jgi:hypothetical protein